MTELSLEQLKELQKQLSKLTSSSTDAQPILSILKKLKAGLQHPTEDIIRQSKIGVAVGKLRSHSDKKVADQAKVLVKDWKAIVDKQRKANTTTISSPNPSGSPSKDKLSPSPSISLTATTTTSSPSGAAATTTTPTTTTPTHDTHSTTTKSEKIDFEILKDKVRNACLKLLYQSLEVGKEQHGWEPSLIFNAALTVEKAILNIQGKGFVTTEYRNKVRSLSLNFKDKNNPQLRVKVVDGEIHADQLVVMSNEDLASDKRRQEIEQLQMQNLFKAKGAAAQEAETDAFQCARCKMRKTRYYQMQTRSADEPMTTFVTCVNCNHKWKFC